MKSPTSESVLGGQSIVSLVFGFDAIPWYYKLIAAVANWAILAGFIIFPYTFSGDKSKFQIDETSLRILAICLLSYGYFSTGMLYWRLTNLLFQLESIFKPGLTSSTIGLLGSILGVYGTREPGKAAQWSVSAVCVVTLTSALTLLYGAVTLNTNRKLGIIRNLDEYKRLSEDDESFLSEEERTRRNLLRLLNTPQQQSSSQFRRYFETPVYSPPPSHPTPVAASPEPPSSSTRYPPAAPDKSATSSESWTYTNTYGQPTTYPHDTIAGMRGGAYGNTERTWRSGFGYSPLTGDQGGNYNAEAVNNLRSSPVTRRNSIFAGIGATIGRGRERIGSAWHSWSVV